MDNSREFVSKVKYTNAKSVFTYDFSTLYTNLPHQEIKDGLEQLLVKMIGVKINFIMVNSKRKHATFSNSETFEKSTQYKKYYLEELLEALCFLLLDNTYV